jgi:hypothetical protein
LIVFTAYLSLNLNLLALEQVLYWPGKGPISEIDLSYLGALKGVEVVYNEEIWRDECINYDTGLLFQFEKGDALLCCLPANFEMKFYLQPHRIAKEMEKLKLRGGVNLSTS